MSKKAFTFVEVMIVLVAVSIIMAFLYRMMSGTSSQFIKNQTRLSNLRAASIIIEQIKRDLRLALLPGEEDTNSAENELKFKAYDPRHRVRDLVTYSYDDKSSSVTRRFGSGQPNRVGQIKVASFAVKITDNNGRKQISVSILVDNDKDVQHRSQSSLGNRIRLQTELYPRFYEENISDEERYWNFAREAS